MRGLATARLAVALIRLFIFLVATHAGRIITAILLIIGGLIYGLTSHNVVYKQANDTQYRLFVLNNGYDYFQVKGTDVYYYFDTVDLNPYPAPAMMLNTAGLHPVTLLYKDDPEKLDVHLDDGRMLYGTSYKVEQVVLADGDGKNLGTYVTSEYQQHGTSYYENHWQVGGGVAGAGILVLLVSFLIARIPVKEKQLSPEQLEKLLRKQRRSPWGNNRYSL